jgi:hypothetical protein
VVRHIPCTAGRLLLVGGTGLDAHPVREVWAADMQRQTLHVSPDVLLGVDDFMMFGACFFFLLMMIPVSFCFPAGSNLFPTLPPPPMIFTTFP